MRRPSWRYGHGWAALLVPLIFGACGDEPAAPGIPDPANDIPTTLRTPADGTRLDRPARNSAFVCARGPIVPPPITRAATPWVEGDSVIISEIAYVQGSVTWQSEFAMTLTDSTRRLKGNGLPNHPTGEFPVQPGTPAYAYYAALPAEGYSSAAEIPIAPYDLDVTLPRNPQVNALPTCVASIFIGVVTQTGASWHLDIAPDAMFRLLDPVAGLPIDSCFGHPYNKQYHYHGFSWKCFPDQGMAGEHSPLFGYAVDGFGVFGPRGEDGQMVTNEDLDECHGHTHGIEWDGQRRIMYHYHVNREYPYSIGCFRGVPVELSGHLHF